MIISVNWLKKFTSIDATIEQLSILIGSRLVELEGTTDLAEKYKDALVVRVVECAKLEGSDHLNVTKIDDGGKAGGVERDEHGYVQVVCGASNITTGQLVVWLPPNSTVPQTYDTKEPFVLGSRKLMGVMSNGMIASATELDLYDDHEGILVLTTDVTPGIRFAELADLDDTILDIENKSLTHRPDTFGIIGFAREIAAIQGKTFVTPDWLASEAPTYNSGVQDTVSLKASIDDASLSDRYQAVVLRDVDIQATSDLELQTYLARSGMRPISAIVDVTNYLMLLTGQPLHAFDYDKLLALNNGDVDLHVRAGRGDGDTLELLDGRTITLSNEDIVIANGDIPIALAGAMGGSSTRIDDTTKNVIIESATFNLYKLRGTQMRHGIFSEAITRFTKGQAAAQTAPVLHRAVELLEVYGGVRVSDIVDVYPEPQNDIVVTIEVSRVNAILGTSYTNDAIEEVLRRVEFKVKNEGEVLTVGVPYWRQDIHIAEDVIEEIGRISSYDSITPTLPKRSFSAVAPSSFDELRAALRKHLVRLGTNEVLTYSFIHGGVLTKAGIDPQESYRITNSISPELQYYRQSLTPSLLGLVRPNHKSGYDSFALFELNKVHAKTAQLVEDGSVPAELHRLGYVISHIKPREGAAYYQAKHTLDSLAQLLGRTFIYRPFPESTTLVFTRPFDLRRSARVIDEASGQPIGIVGEYKKSVKKNFKLTGQVAGFELLTEGLALALNFESAPYAPLSRFPSAERDICFEVDQSTSYALIVDTIRQTQYDEGISIDVSPVDIYQSAESDKKRITIRVQTVSSKSTLTTNDVTAIMERATASVIDTTGAVVV